MPLTGSILIKEPEWYNCYPDEKYFYRWLETIPGVRGARHSAGTSHGLRVDVESSVFDRDSWAALIGLLARYKLDLRFLRDAIPPEHAAWLQDPTTYWYPMIFGDGATVKPAADPILWRRERQRLTKASPTHHAMPYHLTVGDPGFKRRTFLLV